LPKAASYPGLYHTTKQKPTRYAYLTVNSCFVKEQEELASMLKQIGVLKENEKTK